MPRRRQSIAYTVRDLLPVVVLGSPILFLIADPWKSWIEAEVCGPRVAADVQRLAFAADEFHGVHDRWPDHGELVALDGSLPWRDIWDQPFTFEHAADGALVVRSPGLDGRLRTADDIVSWPMRGGERYAERRYQAERRGRAVDR